MPCKIGIIGGASALASAHLYHEIVRQMIKRGVPIPEMIILNYPFSLGLKLKDSTVNDKTLKEELNYCIETLRRQNINLLMIGCNTLHHFLGSLNLEGIELVSIPLSVIETVEKKGKTRLLLLATETSVNRGIYRHHCVRFLTPEREDQKAVDAILDHILSHSLKRRDRDRLCEIALSIALRKKIDGIILGCTDFHVLHQVYPFLLPRMETFDSVQIGADSLIQTYLEKK